MKVVIGNWVIGNWRVGKWAVMGMTAVMVGVLWLMMARGAGQGVGPGIAIPGLEGGGGAVAGAGVRFGAVDVYVDTGAKKLGAYQVEVVAKRATVVGVEGGESKAFNEAPYYDPAALQGGKIVVAAFSTDETLPNGLTRVARLHFMLNGDGVAGGVGGVMSEMATKLVVATDGDGKKLDAKLMFRPYEGDKR